MWKVLLSKLAFCSLNWWQWSYLQGLALHTVELGRKTDWASVYSFVSKGICGLRCNLQHKSELLHTYHALPCLLPWAAFEHANRWGILGPAALLISIGLRKKWPSTSYSWGLTVREEEGSGSCTPVLSPAAANEEIEGRSLLRSQQRCLDAQAPLGPLGTIPSSENPFEVPGDLLEHRNH